MQEWKQGLLRLTCLVAHFSRVSRWRRLQTAIVLALVAWLAPSMASRDEHPWDAPAFTADPAELHRAAAALTTAEDDDVLVVHEESSYVFDEMGRCRHTWRMVYRVLTQDGAEGWSQIGANWSPWHEEKPVIRVRVITPEGNVHWLDPATIAEAGTDSGEDAVFTDRRRVSGPLPAIAPGVVVEKEVVIAESVPFFAGGSVRRFYFGARVPTHSTRLTLDAPSTLPLQYVTRLLPEVQPRRSESDGRVRVVFESGPQAALQDAEPMTPPEVPTWPEVAFSTGKSWQDVADRYHSAIETQIASADVAALVRDARKKSRTETAAGLMARLHKEIRYTGVEYGDASIIPRRPAETLERKYGDCKDKSALLIAMLRASGMPAYLALLDTETPERPLPALPGLAGFDHAIVYAPGSPDLWIDATAEFTRAGHLPIGAQGRLALVIRPETTELVRTPESASADNKIVETRGIFLSEMGPARVVETTETWGSPEENYRSYYADGQSDETRKGLVTYAKEAYLSDNLSKIEIANARDYSAPFRLHLEFEKAKRGSTDETEAAVGIPIASLMQSLPDLEPQQEDDKDEDKDPGEDGDKPAKLRVSDLYLPQPFQTEWRYRIVVPPGFQVRKLPENSTKRYGAATLVSEFQKEADGNVTAMLRFDTGKRRMSPEEAEALRAGVAALRKESMMLLYFDQVGELHLAAGNVTAALEEFRRLMKLHPNEALHHNQAARALLAAGIGEAARAQARLATEIEPRSAKAFGQLAWILQHDLVGRRQELGYDQEGAIAAYLKAKELDPEDAAVAGNLAILLEHDQWGLRYTPQSRLQEAIAEYQALGLDKLSRYGIPNNLPVALMWASRFQELEDLAKQLDPATQAALRDEMLLVAWTGLHGAQAAIDRAQKEIPNAEARRRALGGAGNNVMRLRMYAQAGDLLAAAVAGTAEASNMLARVGIIRQTKRHEDLELPPTDPRSVVKRMMLVVLNPDFSKEDILKLLTREERVHSQDEDMEEIRAAQASMRQAAKANNSPLVMFMDLGLSATQYAVEGDDQTGYRIRGRAPSASGPAANQIFYVVKEDGEYKVLATEDSPAAIGTAVLLRIDAGDLAGARRLLDWIREDIQMGGGEDPLAGPVFPRFWTRGQEAGVERLRTAAAALTVSDKRVKTAIPILLEARKQASREEDRLHVDLALSAAYFKLNQFAELAEAAERLLQAEPLSLTAFHFRFSALVRTRQWSDAEKLCQSRLARLPGDADAIRSLGTLAAEQRQPAKAIETWRQLITTGKATASDMNSLAWQFLYTDKVTEEAIDIAQQANLLTQQNSFAILHTVASLYAEVGKTIEARSMILKAMQAGGMEEPNESSWYVFGRIAEQYGEYESAASAYRRLKAPSEEQDSPTATYYLAKKRLDVLAKEKKIQAAPAASR